MSLRCTSANHEQRLIDAICTDQYCQNQRPCCFYCQRNHTSHSKMLIPFDKLNQWIQSQVPNINNIEKSATTCKTLLEGLIKKLIPFSKLNIDQFGMKKLDQLIHFLCSMQDLQPVLSNFNEEINDINTQIEKLKSIAYDIINNNESSTILNNSRTLQPLIKNRSSIIIKESSIPNNNITPKPTPTPTPFNFPTPTPFNFPTPTPFNIPTPSNIPTPTHRALKFEIMNQNTIKQSEWCCAINFNKDISIVAAACNEKINVFQHKDGKLNKIQELCEHKGYVLALNFMRNSNNFVSSSGDNSIIIWQENQNQQWYLKQRLNEHIHWIFCVLINNQDDQIISSSADKTIKFWTKQNQWKCQQTITDHNDMIYSLNLNEDQNTLISCSHDQLILVIKFQYSDKKWIVTQRIKVDYFGQRLCFVSNNCFIFQPYAQNCIYIYEMDIKTSYYEKKKDLAVKCISNKCDFLFPSQYLKSKGLLVNKNGNSVYMIRKKANGDFMVEQSIQFLDYHLYGRLSDNGEYLIVWDSGSKEISIRKCKEI